MGTFPIKAFCMVCAGNTGEVCRLHHGAEGGAAGRRRGQRSSYSRHFAPAPRAWLCTGRSCPASTRCSLLCWNTGLELQISSKCSSGITATDMYIPGSASPVSAELVVSTCVATFAEPSEDWGAAALAQALYTVSNDVTRVQTLLPELSPADRCSHSNSSREAPQRHFEHKQGRSLIS